MIKSNKKITGIFLMIIATFFWGFLGINSRILNLSNIDVTAISFFRCILASIGFIIWVLLTDKKAFKTDAKGICISAFYGIIGFALCFLLFNLSVSRIAVSVTTVLLFTSSVWVILLDALLFKEPITVKKAIVILITILGCILISDLFNSNLKMDFIGVFAGILTGIAFSLQLVIPKYFEKQYKKNTLIVYGYIFATIFIAFFMNFKTTFYTINNSINILSIILNILSIGILCTFISNTFYVKSTEYISVSLTAILAALEPVLSSIFAWILLGESLTLIQFIGSLIIVFAAIILEINFSSFMKIFKKGTCL